MRADGGFAALVDDEAGPEPKPAAHVQTQPRDPVNPAEQGEPVSTVVSASGVAAPEAGETAPGVSGLVLAPHGAAPALDQAAPIPEAGAPGMQALVADEPAREPAAVALAPDAGASLSQDTAPDEAATPDAALAVMASDAVDRAPALPAAATGAASPAVASAVPAPISAPAPVSTEAPLTDLSQPVRPGPTVPPAAPAPAPAATAAAPGANHAVTAQAEASPPAIKAAAPASTSGAGQAADGAEQAPTEAREIVPARSGTQTAPPPQPETQNQHKPLPSPAPVAGPGADDPGTIAKPTLDPVLHLLTPAPAHAATAQAALPQAAPVSAAQPVPLNALAIEIASQARAGNSRFEIRLDPPELGRIDVRLDIDRDGNVSSRLVIERSDTYDLLRRDQSTLERALQQAGLKTSDNALEFSLRDQGFAQQRDADDRPRGAATALIQDSDIPPSEAASGYARLLSARGGIDIRV